MCTAAVECFQKHIELLIIVIYGKDAIQVEYFILLLLYVVRIIYIYYLYIYLKDFPYLIIDRSMRVIVRYERRSCRNECQQLVSVVM